MCKSRNRLWGLFKRMVPASHKKRQKIIPLVTIEIEPPRTVVELRYLDGTVEVGSLESLPPAGGFLNMRTGTLFELVKTEYLMGEVVKTYQEVRRKEGESCD